jgi:ATP-binding cassette subfamily B protein
MIQTIKTFKRALSLIAPFHTKITVFCFLILISQLISATAPIFYGKTVNAVTALDQHAFMGSVIILGIIWAIRNVVMLVRELYEIHNFDYEVGRHLSKISMEKFFTISMGQHHLGHSAIKRSILNKGEAAISSTLWTTIYTIVPNFLMMTLPLFFLARAAWPVALILFVSIVIYIVYSFHYHNVLFPRFRKMETANNAVGQKHSEIIENADVVIVNAQEARVRTEHDTEVGNNSTLYRHLWAPYSYWYYGGQLFITITQVSAIAYAGYLTFVGSINPGLFITIVMWIQQSTGVLSNIGDVQRNIARNIAPIVKYFAFLDFKPDITIPTHPVSLTTVKGTIEFRDVSFSYEARTTKDGVTEDKDEEDSDGGDTSENQDDENADEKPSTINAISFKLEAGKRYAFVGKSGAGKSTMVNLLLRAFDPDKGGIYVDSINIKDVDYRELRRHIGLVPQDVALFDGTLRYNVAFGLEHPDKVTPEQLERAARLSRVSEFFTKLEKGWDTMIGERGIKLSGGQRQRVGIARALIKEPQILIFDEATSSLDTENEARIRESIQEASAGKTTIIIAHRLATVRDADEILVFHHGALVGKGTHDDLLAHNEQYKELVSSQVYLK